MNKKINHNLIFYLLSFSGIVNIFLVAGIIFFHKKSNEKKYFVSEAAAYKGEFLKGDKQKILEINAHVRQFCYNMFSYDYSCFKSHTDKALTMIGEQSGNYIYNELMNSGIYQKMKDENSRVEFVLDTIIVNLKEEYPIKIMGSQKIIYSDIVGRIPLAARMKYKKEKRTPENPMGMKLHTWEFVKYVKNK